MITLDEAIKHCEEVAKENEEAANDYDLQDYVVENEFCESQAEKCRKCAEEHRQLAEWLKELKELKKTGRWIKVGGYCTPGGDPVWVCSECGKGKHVWGIEGHSYGGDISDHQWVTCPNCGARMEE